jgi:hypothetical protein
MPSDRSRRVGKYGDDGGWMVSFGAPLHFDDEWQLLSTADGSFISPKPPRQTRVKLAELSQKRSPLIPAKADRGVVQIDVRSSTKIFLPQLGTTRNTSSTKLDLCTSKYCL